MCGDVCVCIFHQHEHTDDDGVTHQPDDAQRVVHGTLIRVLARTIFYRRGEPQLHCYLCCQTLINNQRGNMTILY
jgi:hypothetical protein